MFSNRLYRTVPIGGKPVELQLPVSRLGCRNCSLIRQVAIKGKRDGRNLRFVGWNGENKSISPEQVKEVVDADKMNEMAK